MRYFKSFTISIFLATLIFLLGVVLGSFLDDYRTKDLLFDVQNNELNAQSYQIEQEFLERFGVSGCETAEPRIEALSSELAKLGAYLIDYEKKSFFGKKDFEYLTRRYFQLEIRTYTLFNELKERCSLGNNLVLFFYAVDDADSQNQGTVLDVLVEKFDNLAVFSVNFEYPDPLIDTVKLHYGVKNAPTLIINNKEKKEGFTSKEELEGIFKEK